MLHICQAEIYDILVPVCPGLGGELLTVTNDNPVSILCLASYALQCHLWEHPKSEEKLQSWEVGHCTKQRDTVGKMVSMGEEIPSISMLISQFLYLILRWQVY